MNKSNNILLAIYVLLFSFAGLSAQTTQHGIVAEMNSGNKSIAGVAIVAVGAIPTDSDNEGKFQLVFSKITAGKQVIISQVYKAGYEVVNETDLKNWTLSEKNVFKIVLCKKGTLDESRRKFYDVGQDRYYSLYQQSREELETAKNENRVNTEQYNNEVERITAEYERAMSQLAFYADKFARINKDDLNDLDAQALALVEQGKLDEAIKLYEDSKILQQFNEKVAQRDTAIYNADIYAGHLETEIALLKQKNDIASIAKADSIYTMLLRHNDKSFKYNFDYATLLVQTKQFDKAFQHYKQSLLFNNAEEEKNAVTVALNQLYLFIENPVFVQDYKKQISEVLSILDEKKTIDKLF
ncbi:MAG: hypothetical protein LBC68_05260 [Prevotellaceae bacterium]|jgi:hypothetical protein|nr:hypothetical protein [Prevotellaceae bacterium]